MAEVQAFKCDVCDLQQKETSSWFLGFYQAGDPTVEEVVDGHAIGVLVRNWNDYYAKTANSHLCGIQCTMKWVGQTLAAIKH